MEQTQLKKLIDDLALEEQAENQLIWMYNTLLDLGVENCLEGNQQDIFRQGMDTLYKESVMHLALIKKIIEKY
jgi:hypothetical protein